jgi:hypothetical protein
LPWARIDATVSRSSARRIGSPIAASESRTWRGKGNRGKVAVKSRV